MPRFVGKIEINDENRNLIDRITNGKGISREDAERIANGIKHAGGSQLHNNSFADYLFQLSQQGNSVSVENGRTASPIISAIQSYDSRSTTDNRSSKVEREAYDRESTRISREIGAIILNAKKSHTLFKAPNGKPTNLPPMLWIMVRTKNFKEWFGDWLKDPENASKVVDENGEPLVVYHGTNAEFTEFKFTTPRKAFYFGTEEGAKGYTSIGRTMPLFLNIKNPLYAENYNVVSQFDSSAPRVPLIALSEYRCFTLRDFS